MRRPALVLVSGQVAVTASDREFPASTERSGHATGTSPAVVHHGRHLDALAPVATEKVEPAD